MTVVVSSIFHIIQFPHQGKIVTIGQLGYCTPNLRTQTTKNVPFVDDSKLSYESVGVELLKDSSLMGTFPFSTLNSPPKVSIVNSISTLSQQSLGSFSQGAVLGPISSFLPISQDPIPLPSSSSSEHLETSNQRIQRTSVHLN